MLGDRDSELQYIFEPPRSAPKATDETTNGLTEENISGTEPFPFARDLRMYLMAGAQPS